MKFSLLTILIVSMVLGILNTCDGASFSRCKKTIKVAIVDTGLDLKDPRFKRNLCKTGHHNFVESERIADINNHGTHVAGLIQQYAGRGNYCILIEKYYSEHQSSTKNEENFVKAIRYAIRQGANIINLSAGGPMFNDTEYQVIHDNPEVLFIVAAGNDGNDIDIPGNEYYPASYNLSNIDAVGSIYREGIRAESSNYGEHVVSKEVGVMALSTIPCVIRAGKSYCNAYMSGTSMATAIHSGKEVAKHLDTCYND